MLQREGEKDAKKRRCQHIFPLQATLDLKGDRIWSIMLDCAMHVIMEGDDHLQELGGGGIHSSAEE